MEAMVPLAEAARHACCHEATLRRMIKRGDLPGYKVGNRWRVRISELDSAMGATPERTVTREPKGRFARLARGLGA
jgi:excisionase family DNA binding protein